MRGALAAGHPLTAEAGADVLRAGGNAVDACVAAAAVSWVCESPLTGPGGGGFLLVHTAQDARTRLLDFFVSVPERSSSTTATRSRPSTPARCPWPCPGRLSGSGRRIAVGAPCRGRTCSPPR